MGGGGGRLGRDGFGLGVAWELLFGDVGPVLLADLLFERLAVAAAAAGQAIVEVVTGVGEELPLALLS